MSDPADGMRSASTSEVFAEMCDALRIMEIKHPDSIPLERMRAILAAAEAKGWRLVPAMPDDTMKLNGKHAVICNVEPEHCDEGVCACDVWAAMLAGSPRMGS